MYLFERIDCKIKSDTQPVNVEYKYRRKYFAKRKRTGGERNVCIEISINSKIWRYFSD